MLHLWYSPIYTEGLSNDARFPRERYRMVRAKLEEYQNRGKIFFHEPDFLSQAEFCLTHCPDYVNRFFQGHLTEKEIRRIGLKPWTDLMVERTAILTNGTIAATRHAIENQSNIAGNIGGGTHHSYWDFGSGYCIFNDLAIAAKTAQRDYQIKKVLILDLDVHQGDGTAAIFANDPSVRTVSLHCQDNFPFRKMTSDVDIGLPKLTDDQLYLETLDQLLKSELEHSPDIVLFQAGVDVLATDRLGHFSLSPQAVAERNHKVFQFAKDIPLVITMGGGYGEPIETSINAHAQLFEQAAAIA